MAASSIEERRQKRREKRQKSVKTGTSLNGSGNRRASTTTEEDAGVSEWLASPDNEDQLIQYTAKINRLYQEKLKKDAPFITFVFCGMQSTGKSTIMERFMMAVMNIVQEGTGTRCPLDTSCIHDEALVVPKCDLWGEELEGGGEGMSVNAVFECITQHNKKLAEEDRFSTLPLRLTYYANDVQNMRFVDTPGIIANEGQGKDNREDIKHILRSEMKKANTKLCVLLEPKEFSTNSIINFCDESLGGRGSWINSAIFLMNKFDKQLDDSRSASKANAFFSEYHEIGCFPYPVMTPTLAKENLPPDKLFKEREKLLQSADQSEQDRLRKWLGDHELFRIENEGEEETLSDEVLRRLGFQEAKKAMRKEMLADTAKRLPEVLRTLRADLEACRKERRALAERMKFTNPVELRLVAMDLVFKLQKRLLDYLNGDLDAARKFPNHLQTLDEEIYEEEFSEWSEKELNHYTETEDKWRDMIADMEEYPEEIRADDKFMGGKQYQRAIALFRAVMIESLPDPFDLEDIAANGTGFLGGGLQHENWERATVQITKTCMKDVTHPGINYLVKHVGSILRHLFSVALEDVKKGDKNSSTFRLLPAAVEKFIQSEFNAMLWSLMVTAADKTHSAMEPMYTTINADLPTFPSANVQRDGLDKDELKEQDDTMLSWAKTRLSSLFSDTGKAKKFLKNDIKLRATTKRSFLSDRRTSMITKDETKEILQRSFEYIVGLMEFNLFIFQFQLNHYLLQSFKDKINSSFIQTITDGNWEELCKREDGLKERLVKLDDQIVSFEDSLQEVERMQSRF